MKKIKYGIFLTLLATVSFQTNAATTEKNDIEQLAHEINNLKQIINELSIQNERRQDYQPSFFSKNQSKIDIYGFVRADAAYQFEGGNAMFNRINKITLDNDPNKKMTEDRFDATVTTSRIGLDLVSPIMNSMINGKIEVDFRGGDKNDTIRIRHAFVEMDNWLVGQTTSNFVSFESAPEILDFNTALGGGTTRTPLIRYKDNLSALTNYQIGLEKGNDQNRLPAATAKITHKFSNNSGFINARTLVQEVRLRDENDHTKFGWGIGLGTKYNLNSALALTADFSHMAGDDKFLFGSDNTRYVKNDNTIKLIDFNTLQLGATYKFNQQLRSTIGYGALFYENNSDGNNDRLQQGWINVMYNPIKPITFGLEYIHGERKLTNNISGTDSRIEFMTKYEF